MAESEKLARLGGSDVLWSFDTCGCTVEVDWDTVKQENILRRAVRNCGAHGPASGQNLFDACREENGRKNAAIGKLLDQKGISRDKYPAGAKGDRAFSVDVADALSLLDWSFAAYDDTGTRPLQFNVKDPTIDKAQLAVNFQGIGKGRINIV